VTLFMFNKRQLGLAVRVQPVPGDQELLLFCSFSVKNDSRLKVILFLLLQPCSYKQSYKLRGKKNMVLYFQSHLLLVDK
jgi:hypothetical protein